MGREPGADDRIDKLYASRSGVAMIRTEAAARIARMPCPISRSPH
jgi:hypothetical protein